MSPPDINVPVVAELGHQLGQPLGHRGARRLSDPPRRVGEAVAGQRRDDHRVVGQQRRRLDVAQERVGPAVQEQQREPVAAGPVHDVQPVAAEVRQLVERRLAAAPVEAVGPVGHQLAQEGRVGAAIPADPFDDGRPAGPPQPILHIREHGVGHVDPERLHAGDPHLSRPVPARRA
jgi:hypothetical protein